MPGSEIANVWGPRSRREFFGLRDHENREKVMMSGRIPNRRRS